VSDWATALGTTDAAIQSVVTTLDGYASASNSYYSAYSRTALYTGEYNVAIAHNAVIENATGGSANDTITGNSSDNVIDGGAGDDLIEGNGGDDTIDGGSGTEDVAVFNDAYANYTITESGGTYTVAHNGGAGADGTDTITNVEYLEFTDQTIDLSTWPIVTATTTPTNTGAQGASGSGSPYSSGSTSSSSSGTLASADVSTQAGATAAIALTDSVLETISNQLALMGALQNRLNASISNLSSQSVMTEAAIGRIMDTDFSTEMAKLTKSMILSEASNYVLSGAQLSKSNLLLLLK
jgi:flagellin-like hook-associated protein FlgL